MIDSVEDITYDGERLSDVVSNSGGEYMVVNYVGGRSLPNIEYSTKKVSVGKEFISTFGSGPRELYADITVKGNSFTNLRQLINILSSSLFRERDVEITFDDEPNRTYFGRYTGHDENLESSMIAKIRIYFYCTDGKSYADPTTHNVTQHPTVINEGTAETYPIFDISVNRNITELEITNKSITDRSGDNPSIILGRAASIDQTVYHREELVLHDSMNSTNGWQQGSTVEEGTIGGNITTDKDGFYPADYGERETPGWQGPTLQRGIGTPLTDFRADFRVESRALLAGTGMMEFYLRDANGNIIVKLGLGDDWRDLAQNMVRLQVGRMNTGWRRIEQADKRQWWEHFDGIIRVERVRNVYTFYIAQIDKNGVHHGRRTGITYTDTTGQFSAPIHSVQVGFRKYSDYETRIRMRAKEIKLYRINQPQNTSTNVPFIASAGDVIAIDTKTSKLLRNGELDMDMANLRMEMFPFAKGYNNIEISPYSAVNVRARYRNAYL